MVYVEDVDDVFAKAIAAGSKEIAPVQDQFYGDRSGQFEDPFGHRWNVASHVEDVTPEEMEQPGRDRDERRLTDAYYFFLGGSDRAFSAPRSTHVRSCRLVRTSSAATRSQPRAGRPRITIGSAAVVGDELLGLVGLDRAPGSRRRGSPRRPCGR